MSKRIQAIVWSAIALVALIALALTLVLTAPVEESSAPVVETIELINEKYTDLESLHVINTRDDYVIEPVGEELFRIKDTMELVQQEELFHETVLDMATLAATEIIDEDCQDLARFGLDEPKIRFESKYNNGNVYRYDIGTTTATGDFYYICETGKNTVYLVPRTSLSKLLYTRYTYLDTLVLEGFNKDDVEQFPQVSYVKIWNASNDVTIMLNEAEPGELGENAISQQSHLVMREPCFALISVDRAEEPIYGTFGLYSTDIVKANITDEDRTYYGFDKPTARFEIDYNNLSVKLEIGAGFNAADGYTKGEKVAETKIDSYFLIREGVDQIYVVSADDLPWLGIDTKNMISPTLVLPSIMDVDGLDLTVDGTDYVLDIIPGEDITDTGVYTATLNGKDVDMDSVRTYLQLVMMTNAQDLTTDKPTGKPIIEITYRYLNGGSSTVKVYVEDDTTTYLTLNDETVFVGRYGYVGKVLAETKDLVAGGDIDTEW